jgi:hypothetical protein
MIRQPKLFMAMLGCRPKGRFTEQRHFFFSVSSLKRRLIPAMKRVSQ